jgi:catechol 2,3-dioxygenase-like lactoylglutathione lyase family enzyme
MKRVDSWDLVCTEIVVKDFRQSREFYVDKLGSHVEEEDLGRYVMLKAGNARLCVDNESAEEPARGGGATLFFRVDSIGETRKRLRSKGLSCERHSDHGDWLLVTDPEGYRLIFGKNPR